MSGVEVLFFGAAIGAATNLLTNGIAPLLKVLRAAKRCEQECRKLAESVESIQRDVQHILGQLKELELYDANVKQDLCVVVKVVDDLRRELDCAGIEVYECDSASKPMKVFGGFGSHSKLSMEITVRNEKITRLYRDLVHANLILTLMLKDARGRRSSFDGQQYQVPTSQQHQQILQHWPSMDYQQWIREKDVIKQREDSTRHFERLQSEYSLRSASSGSTSSGSSALFSDDSNHDHSSHYTDHLLQGSNTVTSTYYHDVPEQNLHRSSTVPRSDHVTHSSEGEQLWLQDPCVPQLNMFMKYRSF